MVHYVGWHDIGPFKNPSLLSNPPGPFCPHHSSSQFQFAQPCQGAAPFPLPLPSLFLFDIVLPFLEVQLQCVSCPDMVASTSQLPTMSGTRALLWAVVCPVAFLAAVVTFTMAHLAKLSILVLLLYLWWGCG
jgi:hypothetical protein